MNCVQIGSAACAPLSPTGWLSSKPTQTTVSNSGVKPTNHASRRSLVVPDLPAASSVKSAAPDHAMPEWTRRTVLADILKTDFAALREHAGYRDLDRLHAK